MKLPAPRFSAVAATALAVALWTGGAAANGFVEERPWQFDTANDRIAKQQLLDLRERKEGGFYDSFRTQTTNNFTTEVQGDQINCNLNANATALGNSGTNTADARNSSPDLNSSGTVTSSASGNQGTNSADGVDPANSGGGRVNQQSDDSVTANDRGQATGNSADGSVSQAGQLISSDQRNVRSPQRADVTNPNISSDVRGVDTSGGRTDLALNSTQTNDRSPQNASVSNSEACTILRPSQTSGVQ